MLKSKLISCIVVKCQSCCSSCFNTNLRAGSPRMGNPMSAEAGVSNQKSTRSDSIASQKPDGDWTDVMGKYLMDMSQDGHMGAGTSSICRKGKVVASNEAVAIKVYKPPKAGRPDDGTRLMKFRRQVAVLKELQEPFKVPENPRLWCAQLERARPERLFMCLLDHSIDGSGEPGPDAKDGVLYVVSELAQYSLKDFLADRKAQGAPLSKDTVRDMTKALVLVMAGLHAKGLVHLDMKPENLMVFDGCLKLIDVDGCVKIGTSIAVTDPSISFSPCYCAPEWASFLLSETHPSIVAGDNLDCWSVGCTICEFVTLDAILKRMYANFCRNSKNHREAGFLFMDWLSLIKKPPTPKTIHAFDPDMHILVNDMLLVCDQRARKTCAECLQESTYLKEAKFHRSKTNPLDKEANTVEDDGSGRLMPKEGKRRAKHLITDHSSKAIYKGMLFKLNNGADPQDPAQWLERDMWIANNGSLCYYSKAEEKRLVMLDSHKLHAAQIMQVSGLAKEHGIKIKISSETGFGDQEFTFAGSTSDDADAWYRYLVLAAHMDMMPTMRLGPSVMEDLKIFRSEVKNRRMKIENDYEHHFEPVFKDKLWKVKAAGDRMNEADWFQREMWLSQNGSLVYWSVRENRELVYYSSADIHRATIAKLDNDKSSKPWSFQVILPIDDGMEFAPGEFAAESEALREKWVQEFLKFK